MDYELIFEETVEGRRYYIANLASTEQDRRLLIQHAPKAGLRLVHEIHKPDLSKLSVIDDFVQRANETGRFDSKKLRELLK